MLDLTRSFSSFSVNDLDAAKHFYGETLGLDINSAPMGNLVLTLPTGHDIFLYPKPNHEPASFTVLNFEVSDIDKAVSALNSAGVETKIYDDPDLYTDERGISRGKDAGYGPDIAWFRDPSGNVLAVLST